ncbi:NUDIX hydrolase [Celeribacter marinus]|uniref:NUDIX hydrolase n=1 Tax=Celeribacter marinus TaxID=1397108 RepID=UPI003F6D58F2
MALMSPIKTKQRRLKLGNTPKTGVRTQFGALCWRMNNDTLEVLLIKSRKRKRWIIPKGWPMHKVTPAEAAATEAWEEAGVKGVPSEVCLGIYSYKKLRAPAAPPLPCIVAVFPFEVTEIHDAFPEKGQRKRKWMSPAKAASRVPFPELAQIIRHFDPRTLN